MNATIARKFREILFSFTVLVLMTGCGQPGILRAPTEVDLINQPAPELQKKTIEGNEFDLKEYRDKKIVMINFFGTWCPPCRAELPELYSVYRENRKNVQLAGVALNIEAKAVARFLRNLNVDFPVVLSPRNTDTGIPERYEVPTVPTTVVVGFDGDIIYYRPGMLRDYHFQELQRVIAQEVASRNRVNQYDVTS